MIAGINQRGFGKVDTEHPSLLFDPVSFFFAVVFGCFDRLVRQAIRVGLSKLFGIATMGEGF